jgi:hypothetical protein
VGWRRGGCVISRDIKLGTWARHSEHLVPGTVWNLIRLMQNIEVASFPELLGFLDFVPVRYFRKHKNIRASRKLELFLPSGEWWYLLRWVRPVIEVNSF